jgi:hypothetical protein
MMGVSAAHEKRVMPFPGAAEGTEAKVTMSNAAVENKQISGFMFKPRLSAV